MGHRRWYAIEEREKALDIAKKYNQFVWKYAKRNTIRDLDKVKEGFYVGWHKPLPLLAPATISRLVYGPEI